MKNKIVRSLIAVILLALYLVMPTQAASNEFMGGSGTEDDPYIISNKTHLNNVRNYPDAHFRMVTDIEFSEDDFAEGGLFYNEGTGWQTIPSFSGTFDGGGNTISGLTIAINDISTGIVGLFGQNDGTIRSLSLESLSYTVDGKVSATSASVINIGGIAAFNSGVIENCSVQGTILSGSLTGSSAGIGADGYLGGITGVNTGTIRNCSSASNVRIKTLASSSTFGNVKYTGGIAGENRGTVTRCYNTGLIERGQYSGGVAGSNTSTVENCFNTGDIWPIGMGYDEISYSGGICGINSGAISTSYNAGRVIEFAESPLTSQSTGTVTNCYYYVDGVFVSGSDSYGLTKEQMQTEQAFSGFDFSTVWKFETESAYPFPVLRTAPHTTFPDHDRENFAGGNGFLWSPFEISTADHLSNIRLFPSAYYRLAGDISLTGVSWEPFSFSGCLDGGGYTVSNLSSQSLWEDYYYRYGLFLINTGLIYDLDIQVDLDFSSSGSDIAYVGGLVSANNGTGIIRNCSVGGTIDLNGSSRYSRYVGGIAGTSSGLIEGCTNSCSITVDCIYGRAGGIVGKSWFSGLISDCSNSGRINVFFERHGETGSSAAGGIAGYHGHKANISNCTNTGTVIASSKAYRKSGYGYDSIYLYAMAGGIVGWWDPYAKSSSDSCAVSGCTNTGAISAESDPGGVPCKIKVAFAGGICGNVGYDVEYSGLLGPLLERSGYGRIETCRNSGTVSASASNTYNTSGTNKNTYAGAIAGVCSDSVTHCYNTGTAYAGLGDGSITNCYDAGTATSSYTASSEHRVNTQSFCYYLKGSSVQSSSSSVSRTESQMLDQSYYNGFDFENTWIMLPGTYPYPQLRNNLATPVKSIYIAVQPSAPLECIEGYFPSYNGLKVGMLFEDGTSVVTDPWSECFSLLDTNVKETQTVALTVLDCKTADTVDIIVRDKRLDSIELEVSPTVSRYYKDEETIDLSGAILVLHYDNLFTDTVDVTPEMVSGFIPGQIGIQTLTITYGGQTCTFEITVYGVGSISIHSMPTKTEYVQGQPFQPTGGILDIVYTDNVTDTVTLSAAEVSYDHTATGTVTATASYEGKTTTFTITVLERKAATITLLAEPDKLSYNLLDPLDFTGSKLKVVFESADKYSEILTLSADMVSGYDNTFPGYQMLTVQYCGKSTSFLVQVREFIKASSYSVLDSGDILLSVELNLSQQVQSTVIICAYRDGRLVDSFIATETDRPLLVQLKGALATDTYMAFVLGDTYCPLIGKQPVPLSK